MCKLSGHLPFAISSWNGYSLDVEERANAFIYIYARSTASTGAIVCGKFSEDCYKKEFLSSSVCRCKVVTAHPKFDLHNMFIL